MYGTEQEIAGIEKALDLLIEKKSFFAEELALATDAGAKFSLRKQLQNMEGEIQTYRDKIEALLKKSSESKVLATLQQKGNDLQNEVQNLQLRPEAQKALAYLEQASCEMYFEEMDKIQKEPITNEAYNRLKNEYVHGKTDWEYTKRLTVFAREVGKQEI